MDLRHKAQVVSDHLEKLYGIPERDSEENVLDCLILTVLSQNTNDVNRDKGFATLKETFPTWEDVLEADVESIGAAIQIAGLHGQKSRTIKNFLTWLKAERGELDLGFVCEMETKEGLQLLCQHKGIGIKTASVTLAFACGHDVFPVDTHVLRISKRLGLVASNCNAEKAHELLPQIIPTGTELPFHMNLITFGRQICNARKPKCDQCPLTAYCLYFKGEL
ncbi:MAG: endonuclease III [Candidatus Poribacteria bacterium]|nr:endonuclease III [Candidatus Poribacteria bacterium]